MTEPDASLTSGVVRPLRQRLAFRFVTVAMALLIPPDLIASKVDAVGTAMDWLRAGVYDVTTFVLKGDTISVTSADSKRWRDLIIDNARQHVGIQPLTYATTVVARARSL